MFMHNKKLMYTVRVSEPNPVLASLMLEQFGGPQGELAAAMRYFTQGLAAQLAEDGIRVNAVCPGPIWTPLIPATMNAEKVEQFGADTPLGRAGQPAELAPAYVFLASQESSYVTGDRILVTGGRS